MQASTSAALRSFLEHPSRPPDTLKYHELQGFLFTIACAPELVKPSEWMPIVFGEADAEYASLEEAEVIITELMTLYNDVNAAVHEGRAVLPADCEFRSHDQANLDDDAPVSQWSRGFLQGHQWLEETWDPYVPDEIDQDYTALLMTLTFFASSKLAEAYCAEMGDRTVADVAPMMRDAFPDALAQYAHLGLGIQRRSCGRPKLKKLDSRAGEWDATSHARAEAGRSASGVAARGRAAQKLGHSPLGK